MSKKYDLQSGLDAVTRAIDRHHRIHSLAALARHLGISKQAVAAWWRAADPAVPPKQVLPIEELLDIPRHVLRPDLYPHPLRDKRPRARQVA